MTYDGLVERLRALLGKFTREGEIALPWEVWNSCSFRRVKTADDFNTERRGGQDVLSAYNQRHDNHPDLSMPEAELFALIEAVNALPDLLEAITALQAQADRWKAVAGEMAGAGGAVDYLLTAYLAKERMLIPSGDFGDKLFKRRHKAEIAALKGLSQSLYCYKEMSESAPAIERLDHHHKDGG